MGSVSFVKTLMVLLVVFFSTVGTLHITGVYRRARRELNNPRGLRWGLVDVPGLLLLAIVPGAMRFFIPARVERYTTIFVVVALQQDGAITKEQAVGYLHTKGIEAEL